jgi:hypothetical protein
MQDPKPITAADLNILLSGNLNYSDWHADIRKFINENPDLKFPGKGSNAYKMVNVLAHYPQFAFTRQDLDKIAQKLGIQSDDIIQAVNKTTQWGLKRWSKRIKQVTHYALPTIEFERKHTRTTYSSLDSEAKKDAETQAREYFRALAEEPSYELGHKDPRQPLGPDNFVMQPSSINRPHKDKYIFDSNGLPKAINPERLAKNPEQFYSKEDVRLMYEGFKIFLGEL